MEPNDRHNRRQFWLGMAISAACLAAIFLFIEPAAILNALKTARYGYLALGGVGLIVFMTIRAARWRFLMNNDVQWFQVFHIQNIGYMLNMLLPFRLGDVARAVLVGNVPPVTVSRALSTVVVDRLLDMLFIVAFLPFTLVAVRTLPSEIKTAALAVGVVTIGAIFILIIAANQRPLASRLATTIFTWLVSLGTRLSTRLRAGQRPFFIIRGVTAVSERIRTLDIQAWVNRVDDLLIGLSSFTSLREGLMLAVLIIITWIPVIMAYFVGMLAVNLQPTWAAAGFVFCAAALSVAAPSSPGQVGVFHAGVIFALVSILGQPEGPAASFAFLYHALNMVTMVVLGLIGLSRSGSTFGHVVASAQKFRRRRTQ